MPSNVGDGVGRSVFRCTDDSGSACRISPGAKSFRTAFLSHVAAYFHGCLRPTVWDYGVCARSERHPSHGLVNVLRHAVLALPFHVGLLGPNPAYRAVAFVGGLVLCVMTYRRLLRRSQ